MSEVKLSKTQQELYDAMKSGVEIHYMRYMGSFNPTAYYFRADNYRRVTAAVRGLLDKGVAEKFDRDSFGDHKVRIKEQA